MEATHNTLQIIQNYVKTPSIQVDPPKTIKMEDITSTPSSSSSLLDLPSADSTPKSADSKPVKKRKSWGQVLPEPKTALPPRKRAKTADEKEQRRIERVKRNRLAAHNSRERKRQEVEALSERNAILEQHMRLMQQQIDTYRALYPEAKVPSLPKIEYETPEPSSYPTTQNTPAPTQFIHEVSTPAPFSSPDSLLSTMDSPVDTAPSTPGASAKDEFDRTQQSAALLCDLQCQSDSSPSTSAATTTTPPSATASPFLSALTSTILFNFRTFTTMAILSLTSPSSRTTRIPSSTRASMVRRLAMALPAETRARLLSRSTALSSICSPALARSSGAATPRELRRSRLTVKQRRRLSLGPSGSASADRTTRVAISLRGSQQRTRQSSHRQRQNRISSSSSSPSNCNTSLAWDIKRSTRLIRGQLSSSSVASGGQKRTTKF